MGFEKRQNNSCTHIQKCSFKPIAKSDPIKDLSYISSQQSALINELNIKVDILESDISDLENITFPPTYASFWRTSLNQIAQGNDVDFSITEMGPFSGVSINPLGTVITVTDEGVYEISYKLNSQISIPGTLLASYSYSNILRLYINDTPYIPSTASAIGTDSAPANNYNFDVQISNTFQVYLPENAEIRLFVEVASPSQITPKNSNGLGVCAGINIERIG